MLNKFIQKLRKKLGYSQEYVAEKLGISRPTYYEIEQGCRELTISEAKNLAKLLGLSLMNFLDEQEQSIQWKVSEEPAQYKVASQASTIRISVPQKNLKKFKEVFLYILTKVGNKPNVGQSVINKLLYFIDFDYFEKYEEQLIGATYIKNHFGPTPCELIKIVDEMKKDKEIEEIKSHYFKYEQKKYLPLRAPRLEILTALEKDHIDHVLERLSDKSATELSEYSHKDIPWQVHKEGEVISYESVFYRDEAYSVREYDDSL